KRTSVAARRRPHPHGRFDPVSEHHRAPSAFQAPVSTGQEPSREHTHGGVVRLTRPGPAAYPERPSAPGSSQPSARSGNHAAHLIDGGGSSRSQSPFRTGDARGAGGPQQGAPQFAETGS